MSGALRIVCVAIALFAESIAFAAVAKPTLANVPYGDDPRQVVDFYQAKSETPSPLLLHIHGGGWRQGSKESFNNAATYLAQGISVACVEYRLVPQATAAGVKPPVSWPLHDAARALQFVRSKVKDWNLDASRIAATGSSAGGCSSLWLAFHDDMADPQSSDPVSRQSTRLLCAAVTEAQTTLDPQQLREWIPNGRYGAHAFGLDRNGQTGPAEFQGFLAAREKIMPWIREYSPYELVTPDDPPVALYYSMPPAMGEQQSNPTHSANYGAGLETRLKQVGVSCEFVYPGALDVQHPLIHEYLIAKLNETKQ